MANGDQQLDPSAARHSQDLLHTLLVEPAHDACAQLELGRLQAEMLHRHSQVHHAVVLVLHHGAGLSLHVHWLLDHRHKHRHLHRELVHAQTYRGIRQLSKLRPVVHHHEFPRLRIARRRRHPRRLQTLHDIRTVNHLRSVLPVALPLQYKF